MHWELVEQRFQQLAVSVLATCKAVALKTPRKSMRKIGMTPPVLLQCLLEQEDKFMLPIVAHLGDAFFWGAVLGCH